MSPWNRRLAAGLLAVVAVAASLPHAVGEDAVAAMRWELAHEIGIDEVHGVTQWAAGYRFVPPAVLLRPAPGQLYVVLAVEAASVADAGPPRWRIAFALDDGRVVLGERVGDAAGQDTRSAIAATVYGLPAGESAARVRAVRVEAPAGAPVLAAIAAAQREQAKFEARTRALRAQVRLPPARIGEPFAFDLALLDGGRLRSSELAGRPLLIELWATWCTPCVRSARELAELQARVGVGRLGLLGIALDDDPAAVRDFLARHGVDWPQHVVGDAALGQATLDVLGVQGVPSYLLLDARGVLRHVGSGAVALQRFDERLAALSAK
jgi:thiol-disulfide isomerase/thioredoxin